MYLLSFWTWGRMERFNIERLKRVSHWETVSLVPGQNRSGDLFHCSTLEFMQLSDIFLGLGEPKVAELLRSISLGKLKTYQLFDRLKARLHVTKLNSEVLRKSGPRVFERLQERDDDFATELSQAILVSHLDMIQAVLNFLGIPHEEGFFAKDIDGSKYMTEGWQQRTFDQFKGKFPDALLLFYVNHLGLELLKEEQLFAPAA